jgi:hypothetical protein
LSVRLLVVLFLSLLVVGLQLSAGAYTAELGGYPDEASHYVSGLLVHDYVTASFPAPPMKFAEQFYLRYPYLAIGHWPPLFYLLEGLWMLLFSTSRGSIMLLSALITAALAVSTYEVLRHEFGHLPSAAAAVLLLCVPVVQKYAAMVMMDTLLALLSFWAVLYFARFLDSGRLRDSIMFGGLAALAILTKGNAFYLALVPLFAILITRRFHLLRRAAFWAPALMVMLVCLPWHLFTMHLILPTFGDSLGTEFISRSLRFYSLLLLTSLGPAILALVVVGFCARVVRPFRARRVGARWASAGALLLSIISFYCLVPAGIEERYFIAAMPPLFMFFVAGADLLSGRLAAVGIRPSLRLGTVILLATAVFAWTSFTIPMKRSYGLREAVRSLVPRPEFTNSLSLVSSERLTGEGVFVSEVAMSGHREQHAILRASKVLADSDWNVKQYSSRYPNSQVLTGCLEQVPIRFIVLDMSPATRHFEHHRQLQAMVNDRSGHWTLLGVFGGQAASEGGPVYVYRRAEYGNQPLNDVLRASISTNIGGTRQRWPISERLNCQPNPGDALPPK